jgi:hypothetical protein
LPESSQVLRQNLSSGFASVQGIARRTLAAPAEANPAPSHGLSLPSAHEASKVHIPTGVACPLRSALRVWLPSRRFPPFEALPALFRAGGAHGIHPSERPPPTRYPVVSDRKHPRTVQPTGEPAAETPSRPGRPRFLGFGPRGNPSRTNTVLARRPSDAPLGFALLGSAGNSLARISPGLLSRASPATARKPCPAAPQSVDRLSPSPILRQRKHKRFG